MNNFYIVLICPLNIFYISLQRCEYDISLCLYIWMLSIFAPSKESWIPYFITFCLLHHRKLIISFNITIRNYEFCNWARILIWVYWICWPTFLIFVHHSFNLGSWKVGWGMWDVKITFLLNPFNKKKKEKKWINKKMPTLIITWCGII